MANRFGELDVDDAVAFAESIIESWKSVSSLGAPSVPARRELNLALVFLNLKFPLQCCSKASRAAIEERCPDCPMEAYDIA